MSWTLGSSYRTEHYQKLSVVTLNSVIKVEDLNEEDTVVLYLQSNDSLL
jgi:hypothetical protein